MKKILLSFAALVLPLVMMAQASTGQEPADGTYFIMYEGGYLTNQDGSVPRFVASLDEEKPLSQQWSIAVDPATGRYKIVNAQDGRYLNEKGEFTVSDVTNPYEAAWHTYHILRMANGKYSIQNAGSAKNNFWAIDGDRVVKGGITTPEPACFVFDLVPAEGTALAAPIPTTRDVYYIMDGDRYLTNTNPGGIGGMPTFTAVDTPGEAQEWRFIMDPSGKKHYMIASRADGRYINEQGVFTVNNSTNPYEASWHTYLILTKGGMCSVQITQTAAQQLGEHFWNVSGDRIVLDKTIGRDDSYRIRIVAKGEVTDTTEPEFGTLKQYTVNGCIDGAGNTALPLYVTPMLPMEVVLRGAPGFAAEGLTVRYGHNLDGAEFDAAGNRQWTETYIAAENGRAVLDGAMLDGDIALYATFEPEADSEWQLVFSDEFDAEDRSQPTADKWMRCQRYSATWNRWLSDSEEVIYLEDGDLVARAIPNPDQTTDPVPMITGGIKSNGKFGFTYGYVEARIYNNLWTGNFPAFWMMPEDQSLGWPDCGEIDIWEVIDTQNRSYHTVHSNWTYDLKNTGDPQSSFNIGLTYDRYHTFGLAWDATTLTWYVDGKEICSYAKSADQSKLDQGQWPFDKHFHLILNQSVGNGSWAANADVSHTYETRFDWVRVYQKVGMQNTYGTVSSDVTSVVEEPSVKVSPVKGGIAVTAGQPTVVYVYDLQGRKVAGAEVDGTHTFTLARGMYIVGGETLIVR